MKMFCISTLLLLAVALSAEAEPYQVIFETIDCSGSTGFATVAVNNIYKVEDADCSHPDQPAQKLKQMLVHEESGSYNAYTLSQEQAKEVMLEVKAYMKARRNLLERSDAVIVNP